MTLRRYIPFIASILAHCSILISIHINIPPKQENIKVELIERIESKSISKVGKVGSRKQLDLLPSFKTSPIKVIGDKKETNNGPQKIGNQIFDNDKELYASFFDRVYEQLDSVWRMSARSLIVAFFKKTGINIHNKYTQVLVTLNANGDLLNITIQTESGNIELDRIALAAFKEAGRFPNPPKDLVKNGVIVFDWVFLIE